MRSSLVAFASLAVVALFACASENGEEDESEAAGEATGEDAYTTEGKCDGLPRLKNLKTPPGVCVGVVATGFTFSRGIAQLPSGDFVMAEMGGWAQDKGGVWLLRRMPDKTFSKTKIAKLIDKPSGVAVGPDGLPYIGTPKGIFRLDPYEQTADAVPKTGPFRETPYKQPRFKLVVNDTPGDGRHPLSKFAFDQRDPSILYVNVGSKSDNCEKDSRTAPPAGFPYPCPEAEGDDAHGVIRKYQLGGPERTSQGFTVMARGLRNSMALVVHPTSGALVQAENSRDTINKYEASLTAQEGDLPHEELNVIVENGNYGWPYCFDNGSPTPEYRGRVDCSRYTNPALLLPGHASPLGMAYYQGDMFPAAYQNNLIVAYHGYRALGHRLVMVPVDANGIPGGGEPLDIIRGWEKNERTNDPLGAPVDVLVAKDGSIYVTEDKNGDVLRVFFDPSQGNGQPMRAEPPRQQAVDPQEAARCNALASRQDSFSRVQRDVIDTQCVSCHGVGPGYAGGLRLDKCDAIGNAKRLTAARTGGRAPYVQPRNLNSELVLRMKGQGYPQMPAGGLSPEHLSEVEAWITEGAPIPQ